LWPAALAVGLWGCVGGVGGQAAQKELRAEEHVE
jgi:hypothetical protein